MADLHNRIENYLDGKREEMLRDLASLVEIPSVRGVPEAGAPFGEKPKAALLKALEIAGKYGFKTNNVDNYAGEIDLGEGEPALAILGHLDVVPAGDGWTFPPFEITQKDGKVYGRGTSDDKGPVIAALYALRAVKETGISLKSAVRLIVGTSEETGSEDIAYYVTKRKMPPATFTPDSSFPVTNLEKGRFSESFTREVPLGTVVSFHGGFASNAVPSKAQAVMDYADAETVMRLAKEAEKAFGVSFTVTNENGLISVSAAGEAAHASTPYLGNNPITALVSLISSVPGEDESLECFRKLKKLFPHGKTAGEGLGVTMKDDISGEITMTLDILNLENGKLRGVFDSRIPLCATKENLSFVVRDVLSDNGFTLSGTDFVPVHYVDPESPFIRTLLNAYEEFSGRKGYCEAIGGGTYVHGIEGGVAFGAVMPGVNTNMHGADEFMPIDDLITAAKIFAKAIADLCG